jgi:hypothetical protein
LLRHPLPLRRPTRSNKKKERKKEHVHLARSTKPGNKNPRKRRSSRKRESREKSLKPSKKRRLRENSKNPSEERRKLRLLRLPLNKLKVPDRKL